VEDDTEGLLRDIYLQAYYDALSIVYNSFSLLYPNDCNLWFFTPDLVNEAYMKSCNRTQARLMTKYPIKVELVYPDRGIPRMSWVTNPEHQNHVGCQVCPEDLVSVPEPQPPEELAPEPEPEREPVGGLFEAGAATTNYTTGRVGSSQEVLRLLMESDSELIEEPELGVSLQDALQDAMEDVPDVSLEEILDEVLDEPEVPDPGLGEPKLSWMGDPHIHRKPPFSTIHVDQDKCYKNQGARPKFQQPRQPKTEDGSGEPHPLHGTASHGNSHPQESRTRYKYGPRASCKPEDLDDDFVHVAVPLDGEPLDKKLSFPKMVSVEEYPARTFVGPPNRPEGWFPDPDPPINPPPRFTNQRTRPMVSRLMGLTPQQVADGNYLPERLPADPSAHPVYSGLIQIIGPTTLYQWNCNGPSVVQVSLRTAGYDIWLPRAWSNCGQLMKDFHDGKFTTTGYQQAADQLGLKYRYNPKGGVPLGFVRFMKQLLARESTMADLFVGRCRLLTRKSLTSSCRKSVTNFDPDHHCNGRSPQVLLNNPNLG